MIPRSYKNEIDIRKRQIDTLKIFNDNVVEIIQNEEYTVGFLSNGHKIIISVYLGQNFPNDKPRLVVSPLLNHPWINSASGEIQNAPGLLNFTIHSDLGRVVHAVIREFEKPTTVICVDQQRSTTSTKSNVELMFPELNNLTVEELQELNENDEYLNDYVQDIEVVRNLNDELDSLMCQVEALASENMLKETKLEEFKSRLTENHTKFRSLGIEYENLNHQYNDKSKEFTPQHIKELLQIASSTADQECEHQVDDFLNRKVDTQTFILRYMETKKLSAMRKAKEERLSHQLSALGRAAY